VSCGVAAACEHCLRKCFGERGAEYDRCNRTSESRICWGDRPRKTGTFRFGFPACEVRVRRCTSAFTETLRTTADPAPAVFVLRGLPRFSSPKAASHEKLRCSTGRSSSTHDVKGEKLELAFPLTWDASGDEGEEEEDDTAERPVRSLR
jgi:hypothetical protein